jgi:hypothetical protein
VVSGRGYAYDPRGTLGLLIGVFGRFPGVISLRKIGEKEENDAKDAQVTSKNL